MITKTILLILSPALWAISVTNGEEPLRNFKPIWNIPFVQIPPVVGISLPRIELPVQEQELNQENMFLFKYSQLLKPPGEKKSDLHSEEDSNLDLLLEHQNVDMTSTNIEGKINNFKTQIDEDTNKQQPKEAEAEGMILGVEDTPASTEKLNEKKIDLQFEKSAGKLIPHELQKSIPQVKEKPSNSELLVKEYTEPYFKKMPDKLIPQEVEKQISQNEEKTHSDSDLFIKKKTESHLTNPFEKQIPHQEMKRPQIGKKVFDPALKENTEPQAQDIIMDQSKTETVENPIPQQEKNPKDLEIQQSEIPLRLSAEINQIEGSLTPQMEEIYKSLTPLGESDPYIPHQQSFHIESEQHIDKASLNQIVFPIIKVLDKRVKPQTEQSIIPSDAINKPIFFPILRFIDKVSKPKAQSSPHSTAAVEKGSAPIISVIKLIRTFPNSQVGTSAGQKDDYSFSYPRIFQVYFIPMRQEDKKLSSAPTY